jgi:hypothetical protein
LVVIVAGLATRKYPAMFPAFIAEYGGDTLWALAGFLIVGILCPRLPIWKTAVIALAFGYAVEISQLCQAPWLNWLRHATYGLILGWEFGWSDLVCYTVGVGFGAAVELTWQKISSSMQRPGTFAHK